MKQSIAYIFCTKIDELLLLQIYYRKSVLSQDEQITSNGEAFVNYNGIPDWVFEEEVFEDNKALWWSPDGTKLVFGSFNDENVDTYLLQEYGSWTRVKQYPEIMEVRYATMQHTVHSPLSQRKTADSARAFWLGLAMVIGKKVRILNSF